MNRDVVSPALSFAAPGGLPVTPCIQSYPRESDCSLIPHGEYGRFGMPLFRFRGPIELRHSGRARGTSPGISRFRVRFSAAPRNDDYSESGGVAAWSHILVASS